MRHAGYILSNIIQPMLSDYLEFVVFRRSTSLRGMNANHMQTTVICSTRKAVHTFQNANAFDSCMMLAIRMSWFTRDVPFQTCRIPNFDCLVVGGRDEEHVVGGNRKARDGFRMRGHIGDQGGFNSLGFSVTRREIRSCYISSSDRTFMYSGTKILLKFAVIIQIEIFEQIADARFLTIF